MTILSKVDGSYLMCTFHCPHQVILHITNLKLLINASVNDILFWDALKNTDLRTLSQLDLTPPLQSHFGTSTFGTFVFGFRPPPTCQNLGHTKKFWLNFGLLVFRGSDDADCGVDCELCGSGGC